MEKSTVGGKKFRKMRKRGAKSTRVNMMKTVSKYVKNDMLYYASEGTTGLEVVGGEIRKVFSDKVYGGAYVTAWGW